MAISTYQLACERAEGAQLKNIGDDDLVRVVLGQDVALAAPVSTLARATALEISALLGVSRARAARLVTAFELGRRGAWNQPVRGQRCLDPATVHDIMKDIAHEEVEEFHVVLLDVRGRLLGRRLVARGSLSQCPVSPRDALCPAVRDGAHGVIFIHNHPSGDPSPSFEDADLTERLRAAAELVGVVARDHVIVAAGGYFSFVEAGRWRR
jgi:DNA repair protein RadC